MNHKADIDNPETAPVSLRPWHEIVRDTLKANQVRLVTYVPDNVLKPLIAALHADPYFTTFPTAREEEAETMRDNHPSSPRPLKICSSSALIS